MISNFKNEESINPIEEISKIVFKIITKEGSGSGLYYSDKNVIITNYHVVKGFRTVGIENMQNDAFSADVLIINPALDLAILRPRREITTYYKIKFLDSNEVKIGEKVKVLGYPYGMPFTITEGIVSSTKQIVSERNFIQTDAAVNPGNSGGPMINEYGRVLGITTLKFIQAENIAFAIPAEYIKKDLDDIKNQDTSGFFVRCSSCFYLLNTYHEFCPNCGAELKGFQEYFEVPTKSSLEKFIDGVLIHLNIDPVAAQKGKNFWEFYNGSSLIRFFEYKNDYYYLTSPIVKIPYGNLEKFYEYILSNPYPPFFTGIYNNKLYLSYRIHKEDFKESNYEKIKNHMINFIKLTDTLDEYFIKEFSCEYAEESKR